MEKDELIEIGEACFGRSWQAQVASRLRVDRRKVQAWVSGLYKPTNKHREQLLELLNQRHDEIIGAIEKYKDGE